MKKQLFVSIAFVLIYANCGFGQKLFVPGGFSASGIGTSSTTNVGVGTFTAQNGPSALLHINYPSSHNPGYFTFMKIENRKYSGALFTTMQIGGIDPFETQIKLTALGNPNMYTLIGPSESKFTGNIRCGGKIFATEIEVKTNVWSDYVFSSNYNLLPLKALESFISANNHLPEVPTESQVIENGYNINEFNVLLLKKIEELTLYIIELNNKVEAIEKDEFSSTFSETNIK